MARWRIRLLVVSILMLTVAGLTGNGPVTAAASRSHSGVAGQPVPLAAPTSLVTRAAVPDTVRLSSGLLTTTGSRSVALTFDDGPGPYTGQVLDLLDRYHVKATFCLIGKQVRAYAAVVRRMVADGMTLCNHTWDHNQRLRSRSDAAIRGDLVRTSQAIRAVVPGVRIAYFRNPGGAFGPATIRVARSLGMRPLMWSVDPRDWARPGTSAIVRSVLAHTRAGSIVLSHDGGGVRTQTLAAYRTLLPTLCRRFRLIPLPA